MFMQLVLTFMFGLIAIADYQRGIRPFDRVR